MAEAGLTRDYLVSAVNRRELPRTRSISPILDLFPFRHRIGFLLEPENEYVNNQRAGSF